MSYIFLQEQGEESSAECFSAIPVYVLSRLNLTARKSYCNGSGTESCRDSRSGETSERSTGDRGAALSMSSAEDSRARTSASQDVGQESTGSAADSGARCFESFAKYDPASCSWKTHQFWLFEDLEQSLETWPRWGTMHDGECWVAETPVGTSREKECGYLPSPQKSDGPGFYAQTKQGAVRRKESGRQIMMVHAVGLTAYMHLNTWRANPPFWEAAMGWPIRWTDLAPLGMDKFQQWLRSHGKSWLESNAP